MFGGADLLTESPRYLTDSAQREALLVPEEVAIMGALPQRYLLSCLSNTYKK